MPKQLAKVELSELIKAGLSLKKKYDKDKKILSRQTIAKELGIGATQARMLKYFLDYSDVVSTTTDSRINVRNSISNTESLKHDNECLIQEVSVLREKIDFYESIENHTFKRIKIETTPGLKSQAIALSNFSDLHCDEIVDPRTVNGLNKYNPDIAKERSANYFANFVSVTRMLRNGVHIKKAVIAINGDLITGFIHPEENMQNNELSPLEATLLAEEIVISGIEYIANNGDFDEIVILLGRGNHSRTTKKKTFATGYKNSYEWILGNHVIRHFANRVGFEHVKFEMNESEFIYVDIFDKVLRASHGDHFNFRGGVGGLQVPLMLWLYKINKVIHADMSFTSHWHTRFSLPNCCGNGSVIGYNAFAMGLGIAPEEPMMQYQLLDEKRGFTVNTPIFCNKH